MASTQMWRYPQGVEAGRDLTGYEVEARDGSIGSIDQSTQDVDEHWVIVDTGPWIFGKRVLIPAGLIDRVDDNQERVFIDRTREEIKNAPEYDITVGATGLYRRELASYYATPAAVRMQETRVPPPSGRRTEGGRQSRSSSQSRSRSRSSARSRSGSSSRSRSSSSTRSRGRTTSRSRTSDEPTRDELYEQAKKLDVPGRSKMNKTQLKQAISRRRGRSSSATSRSTSRSTSSRARGGSRRTQTRAKANPVEVQSFLDGVSYPTRRGDLIREAERSGASRNVRSTLERLPEKRFADPTEVSEAIGNLRR
ncbi:MAG TPA: DUF2795 domain-containing protein [Gaiellaceae bacterium]|jgi:hypothetical protein|nr:DUF2795 domain-containing protein [Gaiellaceae bacterium]